MTNYPVRNRVGGISGMLFSLPDSYGYAGQGVKLGEKDKIVFWYRPDTKSPTYRAVFADLLIADVTADKLPATRPSQPLSRLESITMQRSPAEYSGPASFLSLTGVPFHLSLSLTTYPSFGVFKGSVNRTVLISNLKFTMPPRGAQRSLRLQPKVIAFRLLP
jgi:hypothetical protein